MPPSSPASKKEKILIVEGDGSYGDEISQALNKSGYEAVFVVKTADEAIKAIYDNLPHAIILDVVLPQGSGYDVIAKKLAEPMLAKVPIFLMSTQGVPINMQQVPQGSVAEIMVAMHVSPMEIVAKMDKYFGHERPQAPSDAAPSTEGQKKLLWVEDDKLLGSILEKKLSSSGFNLIHAKRGEDALESLKAVVPDAIVLDIVLPGMSGLDILQAIRQDERLKAVPVMILSNLSKQSDIERSKSLGAQKFIVKAAVSLDQIISEIREISL